jgi:hypothetical protein
VDPWLYQRWDQVPRRSKHSLSTVTPAVSPNSISGKRDELSSGSVYQERLFNWYETHQTAFRLKEYPCKFTPSSHFFYEPYTVVCVNIFQNDSWRFCITDQPKRLLTYPLFLTHRRSDHVKTWHRKYSEWIYLPSLWSCQDLASGIPGITYMSQPSLWWCQDMVWRFRYILTPVDECNYPELLLLWTCELVHCCFALKMCDISRTPHTRCSSLANTLDILSWMTNSLRLYGWNI